MPDTTASHPAADHGTDGVPAYPAYGPASWACQGFRLPFSADIPHQLDHELAALPPQAQRSLGWRIWRRNAWLHLSGHARHLRSAVPAGARRVLWIYTWTTVGDTVMDLSASHLFPPGTQVDLHIAPQLAGLFRGDPRFGRVLHGSAACLGGQAYDFVLLQDLHAASLKLKRRLAPQAPFASLLGFLHGEMFHRVAFAHQRLAQLLGMDAPPVRLPCLPGLHRPSAPAATPDATRVALALGARDPRRRYSQWPAVMRHLLDAWPAHTPPPRFVLLGQGNAHEDFATIAQAGLLAHCELQLDSPSLDRLAQVIAGCDAFVGADGGPMHLALASRRPGVALFGPVPPHLRLQDGSSLAPVGGGDDINHIAPSRVAWLALDRLALGC